MRKLAITPDCQKDECELFMLLNEFDLVAAFFSCPYMVISNRMLLMDRFYCITNGANGS